MAATLSFQYFKCSNCGENFTRTNAQLTGTLITEDAKDTILLPLIGRPRNLVLLALAIFLPTWLAWRFLQLQLAMAEPPSAIAVIGGGPPREIAAAQLAQKYPDLPVIVLGGSSLGCLNQIFFQERKVAWQRVIADYRSASTLTNLTTLLPYLKLDRPSKVIVVTDTGGWSRAKTLGSVILGGHGVAMVPALVDGEGSSRGESTPKIVAEVFLAIGWTLFGDASLPSGFFNSNYMAEVVANTPSGNCTKGYNNFYPVLDGSEIDR
ncbi:MAG: YdcF family protein [Anaerolineae bacterium]|nr:YdcF family protein [Gloeobacterales cyanobacterium ES-bin-313]